MSAGEYEVFALETLQEELDAFCLAGFSISTNIYDGKSRVAQNVP